MATDRFLHDIGTYKCLQGNDLRFLLVCIGRDMYPKNVAVELGWKKQNISNTARKLKELGLLTINAYPVYYRTNEKWASPEIPGQLGLKVTNKK
ncbi:MAG: helix-turn-helix domain-containing protein [Lachnospiraceae bacterium]|nr:helix-turn-helix domain-containing protein [Lachnospiraceae bacterium]